MAWHYKLNIKVKALFSVPINELLTKELPPELFELDILDGSCHAMHIQHGGQSGKKHGAKKSTFAKGRQNRFCPGLFFDYLDLVE